MTENKRFIPIFDGFDKRVVGAKDNGRIISFMDMFDLLNKLSEENHKLKQLICDNYEEELCNLCKHQYLVSHKVMQGYYVAKCKKGYEECGKGTVYCCNDFEFKELQE